MNNLGNKFLGFWVFDDRKLNPKFYKLIRSRRECIFFYLLQCTISLSGWSCDFPYYGWLDRNFTSVCILFQSTLDDFQGHLNPGFRRIGRVSTDSPKSSHCGWPQIFELEDMPLWILLSLGFECKKKCIS